MKKLTVFVTGILLTAACGQAIAAHANSWADGEDAVLSANHDENQEQSIGTPGADEMNGAMTRGAHGKNGTTPNGGIASTNSGLGTGGGASGALGGAGRDR